jgi:hypothetical protein
MGTAITKASAMPAVAMARVSSVACQVGQKLPTGFGRQKLREKAADDLEIVGIEKRLERKARGLQHGPEHDQGQDQAAQAAASGGVAARWPGGLGHVYRHAFTWMGVGAVLAGSR